jgi:hypothetical protein
MHPTRHFGIVWGMCHFGQVMMSVTLQNHGIILLPELLALIQESKY